MKSIFQRNNTLASGDYASGSNVNLTCDNDFLYKVFFSDYDLKMTKIGRQSSFNVSPFKTTTSSLSEHISKSVLTQLNKLPCATTCTKGFSQKLCRSGFLSIHVAVPFSSVSQVLFYHFRIRTTISLQRGVLGITISNLEEN